MVKTVLLYANTSPKVLDTYSRLLKSFEFAFIERVLPDSDMFKDEIRKLNALDRLLYITNEKSLNLNQLKQYTAEQPNFFTILFIRMSNNEEENYEEGNLRIFYSPLKNVRELTLNLFVKDFKMGKMNLINIPMKNADTGEKQAYSVGFVFKRDHFHSDELNLEWQKNSSSNLKVCCSHVITFDDLDTPQSQTCQAAFISKKYYFKDTKNKRITHYLSFEEESGNLILNCLECESTEQSPLKLEVDSLWIVLNRLLNAEKIEKPEFKVFRGLLKSLLLLRSENSPDLFPLLESEARKRAYSSLLLEINKFSFQFKSHSGTGHHNVHSFIQQVLSEPIQSLLPVNEGTRPIKSYLQIQQVNKKKKVKRSDSFLKQFWGDHEARCSRLWNFEGRK